MIDTTQTRKQLDALLAEYTHASRQVAEEEAALLIVEQEYKDAKQAQEVLQHAAQAVQEAAHDKIALIVTRCLRAVFGDDSYEFAIGFERKRGRTEAKLTLKRGGMVLEDPLNEAGGGVIDVCSFALRLACLLSSHSHPRKLLVLDEPFRMISKVYRPRARKLIETLAAELSVQVILVTHCEELRCGKVIEL